MDIRIHFFGCLYAVSKAGLSILGSFFLSVDVNRILYIFIMKCIKEEPFLGKIFTYILEQIVMKEQLGLIGSEQGLW
jgi:hypothetical protein